MNTVRGVVYVHSAPVPLCPHIEWAIGAVIGRRSFTWDRQPALRNTVRTELSFSGAPGFAAQLASRLVAMQQLRFEVTQEPSPGTEGFRYAYTPELGLFTAQIGVHGDILVSEERLRNIVSESGSDSSLADSINNLLGSKWDDELDVFRQATEDVPVRWLHQVV